MLDQLSMRQRENRVKEEDASAPSDLPAAPAPPLREEYKSSLPSVGKPAKMAEKGESSPRLETNVPEDKADLRTGVMATPSASGPKADESLQGSRLTAKKAGEAGGAGGTLSPEVKPSQEFVLRVKDQKGTLPQLEGLTKQVQGIIVNAAKDNLLISLPESSLPEFRNELEKIGSVKEKVPPVGAAKKAGPIPDQASMEKRREAKGKDKEADSSVTKEGQVLIQINLIEE
jgi:hypothetical protein